MCRAGGLSPFTRTPAAYVSYAAPGRQVSRYSLRDNRTIFFFVFSSRDKLTDAQQDLERQKEILRDTFGRDSWECPGIMNALDNCTDLYFDSVSQIRMNSWSEGRIALIGDACFCVSLLAGQGSALAMTGAYILAGELKNAGGDHRTAFAAYEKLMRPLIARKQETAARFAGSFAPKSWLGIFVRNQVTKLMFFPVVADLAMGRLLKDKIPLPEYN